MKTEDEIYNRVYELRAQHADVISEKDKIRAIMNGGADGIKALLGKQMRDMDYNQIPAPNMLHSAMERFAQKLGRAPDLKIDIFNDKDSERATKRAEKLERIVHAYDEQQKLELQLPQVGRWLPGYGFAVWVLKEKKDANGVPYPYAEVKDPYLCYPGYFGEGQQPKELAIVHRVPHETLAKLYPNHKNVILDEIDAEYNTMAYMSSYDKTWANQSGTGKVVAEYYDDEGTYIFLPENKVILDFIPNPLKSGPRFVVAKRFAFDQMQGQFHHVIGLMANMAKINVLSVIAMEDAVFTETNIIGEIESGQYKKGRLSVNYLTPGSQVSKPTNNLPYQLFQQIDRLERHLRLGSAYPVSDDGQSPNAFVTGRGLEELGQSASLHVREYQVILKDALEQIDTKRLEWDETMYPNMRKPIAGFRNGTAFKETYVPGKDIAEMYKTRRIYGVMAGFDEPQKIITGLQLKQQGIIDKQTLQENMDGLDNISQINSRINAERAENVLFESLMAQAAQGNPKATMAAIEIKKNPQNMNSILEKFYTPEGDDMTPEEVALAQAGQQQAGPQAGPPPGLAQVLAQAAAQGGGQGG
jgi:hypothetical protein